MNADGSGRYAVSVSGLDAGWDAAWDDSPSWSPDNSRLVFQSNRGGNWDIYVMNADGSGFITRLTSNWSWDFNPSWSPDGSKIAFESKRHGAWDIYVMNTDGSEQTRLTNFPTTEDRNPSWSPDGSKIAFESTRHRRGSYDHNSEIYVMNADGSNPIRLTDSPQRDQHPSWSPDGEKITFSSQRDGNWEIYVINADRYLILGDASGQPTRLTANVAKDEDPSW